MSSRITSHCSAQGLRIGLDGAVAPVHLAANLEAAPLDLGAELVYQVADESAGIDALEVVRASPGFHRSEVEQQLDQPLQPPGRAGLSPVVSPPRCRRQVLVVFEQFVELAQRGQRRAELVRDGADEVRLGR